MKWKEKRFNCIHSLTQQILTEHLLCSYTLLSAGDSVVNRIDTNPCPLTKTMIEELHLQPSSYGDNTWKIGQQGIPKLQNGAHPSCGSHGGVIGISVRDRNKLVYTSQWENKPSSSEKVRWQLGFHGFNVVLFICMFLYGQVTFNWHYPFHASTCSR